METYATEAQQLAQDSCRKVLFPVVAENICRKWESHLAPAIFWVVTWIWERLLGLIRGLRTRQEAFRFSWPANIGSRVRKRGQRTVLRKGKLLEAMSRGYSTGQRNKMLCCLQPALTSKIDENTTACCRRSIGAPISLPEALSAKLHGVGNILQKIGEAVSHFTQFRCPLHRWRAHHRPSSAPFGSPEWNAQKERKSYGARQSHSHRQACCKHAASMLQMHKRLYEM